MSYDLALLLLRLVTGGLLVGHGGQKLFGWFGGPGLAGIRAWLGGQMRLRPAAFWATMAGLSELGGGLLLLLGFLTPLGSLGVFAAMLMAIILAHWPRIWASEGGLEFPLALLSVALAVGLTGPGAFSIDALLATALPAPLTLVSGLVLVLAGVGIALATRAGPGRRGCSGQQRVAAGGLTTSIRPSHVRVRARRPSPLRQAQGRLCPPLADCPSPAGRERD